MRDLVVGNISTVDIKVHSCGHLDIVAHVHTKKKDECRDKQGQEKKDA